MSTETVKLNNGLSMPLIGFGTWDLRGADCASAVEKMCIRDRPDGVRHLLGTGLQAAGDMDNVFARLAQTLIDDRL